MRRRLRRWLVIGGVALAFLVVVTAADAFFVWRRVDQVDIQFPAADDVDTWLLLGSDDRRFVPAGNPDAFGTTREVPTRSADVLVVYQRRPDGSEQLIALNRDLVLPVAGPGDRRARLGPQLQGGEQSVVDLVCSGLGIAADHVVVLDLQGVVELIDGVGGVEVDVEEPVRDDNSGLVLETAGPQVLDGATALAWLRSRHPQHLENGIWVPVGATAGERPARGTEILRELADRLSSTRNPLAVQQALWGASDHVTVDDGTGARALLGLARRLAGDGTEVEQLDVEYGAVDPVPVARVSRAGLETLTDFSSDACTLR